MPKSVPSEELLRRAQVWSEQLLRPAGLVSIQERDEIVRAGCAIADRMADGGRLVSFGAGHSWCIAAELCSRAGGLPGVIAMSLADIGEHRDQWLQLADSEPERDPDLAQRLIDHHGLTGQDALLIVTNSGRNGVVVELADRAQRLGCLVVVLVSLAHLSSVTSRHPGGARVTRYADYILDNHGVPGDAVIEVAPGLQAGSTSTIAGALIAQLLSCTITDRLARQSDAFTTIRSANLDPEEEA